jgi:hypothetical protein
LINKKAHRKSTLNGDLNRPMEKLWHPPPLCLYVGGEHFTIPEATLANDFKRLFMQATADTIDNNNSNNSRSSNNNAMDDKENSTFADLQLMFQRPSSSPPIVLNCHKCVLASRSTYFYTRLNNTESTSVEDGIFHSTHAIIFVLLYLYTGGQFDPNEIEVLIEKDHRHLFDLLTLTVRWWGVQDQLYLHLLSVYVHNQHRSFKKGGIVDYNVLANAHHHILLDEHERRNRNRNGTASRGNTWDINRGHIQEEGNNQEKEDDQDMYLMTGPSLPLHTVPFPDLRVEQIDEATGERTFVTAAHRCILVSRSVVFRTMLGNSMEESNSRIVTMRDGTLSSSLCLYRYIYASTSKKSTSAVVAQASMRRWCDGDEHEARGETKGVDEEAGQEDAQAVAGGGLGLTEENVTDVYVMARRYMLKRLREVTGKKILNLFDLEDVESVVGLWCWASSIEDDRMCTAAGWYLSLNFSNTEVVACAKEYGFDKEQLGLLATSAHLAIPL